MSENIVKNMSKDAVFTSVCDGYETKAKCKVNMYTREVFDIDTELESSEDYHDMSNAGFRYEYITIDDVNYYTIRVNDGRKYGGYCLGFNELCKGINPDLFWYDNGAEDFEECKTRSWWSNITNVYVSCKVNRHTHEVLSYDIESIDKKFDEWLSISAKYMDLEEMIVNDPDYDYEYPYNVIPKSSLQYYTEDELPYLYWYDDDIHYINHYKKNNDNMYGYVDNHKPLTKCVLIYHDGENIEFNNGEGDRSYKKHFDNYEDAYNQMLEEFTMATDKLEKCDYYNRYTPRIFERYASYSIKPAPDVDNWWMIVEEK